MDDSPQQRKSKFEALLTTFSEQFNQFQVEAEIMESVDCVICGDEIGAARTRTKCGHEFCTECLLDCVAKNTGTVEGTTRHLCPMCREPMCDEIEVDAKTADTIDRLESNAEHWESQCYLTLLNKDMVDKKLTSAYKNIKKLDETLAAALALLEPAVRDKFLINNPAGRHPIDRQVTAPRRRTLCGNCHEVGHNRRTCQAAAASSRPPPPQSPDDRLIEEYLTSLDEITPATYAV